MSLRPVFACPRCRREGTLSEHVTVAGLRGVTSTLEPGRSLSDRVEVDTQNIDSDGMYVCGECEWEGARVDLLLDGQDQHQIPGQLRLAS